MDIHLDPASLLREARERMGISQRALADRAGTSQSVIARIEKGHSNPTVSTLNRLLEAAGYRIEARLSPTSAVYRARATAYFEDHAPAGIIAAYLHGSTARGMRHKESDVDIGVLVDREAHPNQTQRSALRVRLASELVAALGTNAVDVVVLNDVPPGLAARIVLDGTLLMMSDAEKVHAFQRDIQLRRADLAPFLRRTNRLKREALAR
ncbi:MAG: helix-turn-helix domain-containing protein [Gemmatimonadales bacterium]|nr:MAG: helix-turn-helix domain-containing protein [Gemmatimonadales bacterium]